MDFYHTVLELNGMLNWEELARLDQGSKTYDLDAHEVDQYWASIKSHEEENNA